MGPREWFALVARYFGISTLIGEVEETRHFLIYLAHGSFYPFNIDSVTHVSLMVALGIYLLFFTSHLTNLVVRERAKPRGFPVDQ